MRKRHKKCFYSFFCVFQKQTILVNFDTQISEKEIKNFYEHLNNGVTEPGH